ncbi:MAG: hypothetical protein R2764_01440 [Bacteroidales bacterium]
MDTIYRSIVKQLQTEVPAIKWIDLDGGQLEAPDENYPVQFPAVFIDFRNIQYQQLSRNTQQAVATISVRVAFDIYEDFHGNAPDLELATDRLRLLHNIYVALHGFSGLILPDGNGGFEDNHFSKLQRQSIIAERRGDALKVYNITFQCAVRDLQAAKTYISHWLDDITIEHDSEI